MLVSVTGGTGFVGAHSVAAVLRAGHRVRLLVRDEGTVERALAPLGVDTGALDDRDADAAPREKVRDRRADDAGAADDDVLRRHLRCRSFEYCHSARSIVLIGSRLRSLTARMNHV